MKTYLGTISNHIASRRYQLRVPFPGTRNRPKLPCLGKRNTEWVPVPENTEPGAGSRRKTPEINGTWKQYSHQKNFELFSGKVLFFLTGTGRKSTGKWSKNFRPEYCFHVPLISDFSGFFLRVPAVSGGLNDRPEAPVSGNAELWAGSRIWEDGTRSSERVLVSGSVRP